MTKINEHHSFDKQKGLLYLNEKEMYLSKTELKLFSVLFDSFDKPVAYESIDIKESIRQSVVSNLNVKLKGIVVRKIKEKNSLILTVK